MTGRLHRFLFLLPALAGPLAAQQEAVVEQLAPLVAAEDARSFQPELFRRALVSPDSLVRRMGAMRCLNIKILNIEWVRKTNDPCSNDSIWDSHGDFCR